MESAVSFRTTVSPCEYLPNHIWQLRFELVPHLRPADYMQRLQQGWRRFGYRVYQTVVKKWLVPALGAIRLQHLKAADIKRYYTDQTLSVSTLAQHHAILHGALKAACSRAS